MTLNNSERIGNCGQIHSVVVINKEFVIANKLILTVLVCLRDILPNQFSHKRAVGFNLLFHIFLSSVTVLFSEYAVFCPFCFSFIIRTAISAGETPEIRLA